VNHLIALKSTFAAAFAGGGPIAFANIKASAGDLANNGVGLGVLFFVLLMVIGIVVTIAGQRGKADVLAWLGSGIIAAIAITAFIAWGTANAGAAVIF
jgi:hypothetical protein